MPLFGTKALLGRVRVGALTRVLDSLDWPPARNQLLAHASANCTSRFRPTSRARNSRSRSTRRSPRR